MLPKLVKPVDLTEEESKIFDLLLGKENRLKSTKPIPKQDKKTREVLPDQDLETIGKAAYVWRMLCFHLGTRSQDRSLPVCAVYDLPAPSPINEFFCYSVDKENPRESHRFEADPGSLQNKPEKPESWGYRICPDHPGTAGEHETCSQSKKRGEWSSELANTLAKQLDNGIVLKIRKTTRPAVDPVAAMFGVTTGADAWRRALTGEE